MTLAGYTDKLECTEADTNYYLDGSLVKSCTGATCCGNGSNSFGYDKSSSSLVTTQGCRRRSRMLLMQIFIKVTFSNNKMVTLAVDQSESIGNIKAQIYTKEGIPPEQQLLKFNNQVLQDGQTLANYCIQDESTVILVLKDCYDKCCQC